MDLSIIAYFSNECCTQKLLIRYSEWEFINEQPVSHGAVWRVRQSTENLLVKYRLFALLWKWADPGLTGEKMSLVKIVFYTSTWKGSKFRHQRQPEFWNFLFQCSTVFLIALSDFSISPVLTLQTGEQTKVQLQEIRVLIIISCHLLGGGLVLQKCFCGCWLAAGKCWVRNPGFNSQQCALSGTEGFSLISFTYFCSLFSPLVVISQAFHFICSLIIHLYTMDCGQTSLPPHSVPFIFPNSNILPSSWQLKISA